MLSTVISFTSTLSWLPENHIAIFGILLSIDYGVLALVAALASRLNELFTSVRALT